MRAIKKLRFIFMPSFWIINCPISNEWDKELNAMLDATSIHHVTEYYCKIGDSAIWIENYPYGYAQTYKNNKSVMPHRDTIVRLKNAVEKYKLDWMKK